ncbi:MAG: DUF4258 domain-containing protein [Chloroflexi bacterium]|nr:DUF4258 domain-containing protein [Chloroflexota bacterium]
MDIGTLRQAITSGAKALRITSHAQIEAFKDGLSLADLRKALETGRVIEAYPEGTRALLYALVQATIPVHLVVEDAGEEVVIVTVYVPDERDWIGFTRRRRRPGRQ